MLTVKQKELLNKYTSQLEDKAALTIYPFRYEIREEKPESNWKIKENVIFSATLISTIACYSVRGRNIARFSVMTSNNEYQCIAFNQPYLRLFKPNEDGKVTIIGMLNKGNQIIVSTISNKPIGDFLGIVPVYPLFKSVKQNQVRNMINKVVTAVIEDKIVLNDVIPTQLMNQYRLLHHRDAIIQLHKPQSQQLLRDALRTLKYEEALQYQIALNLEKKQALSKPKHKRYIDENMVNQWISELPYELTKDQQTALSQIINDIKSDQLMRRLLLGDVGSGKTIVSFLVAKAMLLAGFQVVLLAPTEVLALQHYQNAVEYFDEVLFLSGTMSGAEKKTVYERCQSSQPLFVIGTHALFNDDLKFSNLGCVIMDEQHRFGVNQRQKLIEKGQEVDVLMLSATPIPRTLAATIYSNLDISTIEQAPRNRGQVTTKIIGENSIRSIVDAIQNEISQGGQVYIVASSISEENQLATKSVEKLYKNLAKAYPNWRIGYLHSKLDNHQIVDVLDQFKQHQLDVLVTTTVIEVGIDIKNANMMIIYDADRFGLSQLHQLRGRIGRGEKNGICYVLSSSNNEVSLQRLHYFEKEQSGFELAKADLKLRGSGDLLGQRQSGYPNFTLLDIGSDDKIMSTALTDAVNLIEQSHPLVKQVENQLSVLLMKSAI